ncbi:hypothetical protein SEA_SYDNAT_58 [Mycobacterium phage SydNat]|uniref:Uncharacterized protein n=1 Tax=Mycobacterium phage Zolita TaxID=2593355 RepID=A0A514U2H0_9CAUD|nr:hypothetical protein KIP50_gp34 [Mycobacterium phage Zolita]QDK03140.1 hypothetical protein SEA_ZOLITA_57 [Mycobacterium phage Zolita]UVK64277.1 hypothetical protein SEA_SYDNAT_58 [Mycobacterium phage SydNat]UVK64364.1 hypothetical protein SEA_GHOULBOY_58 [Mycobacterium phage Ghoulboy]
MSFQAEFNAAFKHLLEAREGIGDISEIVTVEEDTYYGGYCETCAYEEQIVRVHYIDKYGAAQSYMIWESLSCLINQLLRGWPD